MSIHQARDEVRPSAIIAPHSGAGGCDAKPEERKSRDQRMFSTKSDIEKTMDELMMLGSAWPNTMRRGPKPRTRAAST